MSRLYIIRSGESMALAVGTRLGPYEVTAQIGAGGMGEVYKAWDSRLDRTVALKVLPEHVAADPELKQRFEREAKTLASLSHPHICLIHDVGSQGGIDFLVMECLEGETLAERLTKGALSLDEALQVAVQIADALDKAHGRGIVHRDLKPGNVMLTKTGAKLLDFGLAKSIVESQSGRALDERPTITAITRPGIVLGTPEYMSPEQLRGEPSGKPADVWAFGCVLYELLSGRGPFAAASTAEVVAHVLTSAPDWTALPPATPERVRELLRHCLEKDLDARLQEIAQAQTVLDSALRGDRVDAVSVRDRSITSLAVLPLMNAGGDPQMDYLGDGLSESLVLALSKLPQLRVAAQSTVLRYKGQSDRPQEIGRALGVEAVLTGRVHQRGPMLRIAVELVDVDRGWQIWGRQYRRRLGDIFEAEEEIAREISENLRLELSREQTHLLTRRYTENVEAYHLYLKGRFHWAKRTEEGLARSISYFRQAIESDPTYALAYAGLAESYIPQGYYCLLAPGEAFPRARAAAERALEIDPDLSEARTVIASVKSGYEWDLEGADRDYRHAIAQNPDYPRAYQGLAENLAVQGHQDEAVAAITRALGLDPLSSYLNAAVVMTYYFARRFEAAVTHGRAAMEIDPGFYPAHLYLGLALQQTGQLSDAIAELEHARRLSGDTTMTTALAGAVQAAAGRAAEARDVLRRLDELAGHRYVSKVFVAAIHAALGDSEGALSNLDQARRERCCWFLRSVRLDARFDSIRHEPRFQALMTSSGATG